MTEPEAEGRPGTLPTQGASPTPSPTKSGRRPQPRIGTSGWSYDHWVGPFYPEGLHGDARLARYAERFDSVEIDNSFYQLPSEETLLAWRDAVPDGFRFAVKASRYVTHMKKLKDPESGLDTLFRRIQVLGERLGPVLFQLPPRWHFNGERLEGFLRALSGDFRCAFELRDPSWVNDDAINLLERFGAAFCIYELDGYLSPRPVTADFVYIRLHGPDGPYRGSYDRDTLAGWARSIAEWQDGGLACWCFFDNDEAGYAPANALTLRKLLGQTSGHASAT